MVDLFQVILVMLAIGLLVNRFIDAGVGMALPFYLRIRGVKMDSKKIMSMVGAFLLEMVPGVDSLPLWCMDGYIMMRLDRISHKSDPASQQ